jgi:hypothetical protein
MGGSENPEAKIAELLALLNAPEEQDPKGPPGEEVQPPPQEISTPDEISAPDETRFAKNVTYVMQKHTRQT